MIVEYGPKYEALYAHLERFADIKKNLAVKKGQVIGYLGSSGWATGPHLHFELHVYGVPRDPMKVKSPTSIPAVPDRLMAHFRSSAHTLLAQLKMHNTALAENRTTPKNINE